MGAYGIVLGAVLGLMALWWALSVRLRDASIVDVFWGPGFAVAAWLAFALGDESPRGVLVAALVTVWGVRLGAYLFWRNAGRGEDPRYRAMRARYGTRFWWVSAFVVFALQGGLMWLVALPLQAVQLSAGAGWNSLDALAGALWALGMAFEAGGDAQLARFRSDPANAGRVLDRGLWRYTRHPNYFGDFLVWWGFFLFALAHDAALAWTALGPLLLSVLLLRVSGVTLLERRLNNTRPGYAEYVRRTSAFFPRPPRR